VNKVCILGTIIFFALFIVFLVVSLYVFNLSVSMITKYKTVSYMDMTGFLIDTIVSISYLLLAIMLLLVAGVALYGSLVSMLSCEKDYF
jgi:hypothetical protein